MRLAMLNRSASLLALAAAAPLWAQTPQPAPTPAQPSSAAAPGAQTAAAEPEDTIVVTGIRESLRSAQQLKERAPQIVDAIVAEDIGKLPDLNTAQTAARIPGLQVYRQGGEAQNVLVRGLPFFTTTYNGREIYTAETRVVALQDFPSSNIGALEVFKTSSADLVQPGLAGIVNVRSRKPFDFTDGQVSGRVWGLYTRQGGRVFPNANLLATKRFDTGIGEIGVLVQGSWQDMRYLDAEISNTDFIATPTINGQNVRIPDIQRLFYRSGTRGRPSANVQLQWRPTPDLEIYAEGLYQGFLNNIDDRLLQVPLFGVSSASNIVLRPGTNQVSRGTVTTFNQALFSFQGATFNRTDTFQIAGGARFTGGPLKVNIDIARGLSTFRGSTLSVDRVFNGTPTVNFNNETPSFGITGINFLDPAGQTFQGLYEENQRAAGRDWQARIDATYDVADGEGFLRSVQAGARFSDRNARRNFGNNYSFLLPLQINQTALPLQFAPFDGYNFQPTFNFASPTYDSIRSNITQFRQFIIAQCPRILTNDPGNGCRNVTPNGIASPLLFQAKEKSYQGYGQVNFGFGDAVSGTVGVRVQRFELNLPNVPAGSGTINVNRANTDWLPNASLLFKDGQGLQFRLAASKTVTRPDFAQLGQVTFGAPPPGGIGTQSNPYVANGGNPFLRPFQSWNYDASLEYYFSRAGFVSVAVFHRDLKNFIQQNSVRFTDPVLGVVQVNGPINTGRGRITGVEAQGQVFLDELGLPEWSRAFGVQANVTYLDAKTEQQANQANTLLTFQPITDQLNGVSRWNYNIVGIFESGPVSARLSYNNRSSFRATQQFRGDDIYSEFAKPAGRLDLSASYGLGENFGVFFDWTNITRTPFRQNFTSARAGASLAEYVRYLRYDESTVSLGLRFNFGR